VTTERACVLVCDDEKAARRGVTRALGIGKYDLVECENGQQCLSVLSERSVDLVLLDLRMPVMDGRAALDRIIALSEPPPVVVLTADTSIQTAIEAVNAGAADFVTKPYEIDELRFVVERTLSAASLRNENKRLEEEVRSLREGGAAVVGESRPMRDLIEAVGRVAPTPASVLVTGETGTGKGLVARLIHRLSAVASGPFVTVNCTAIPETLAESELFGHRRGAFTGATRDQEGKVRSANGGTLFLDEIGDMSLGAQAKLLRVLQDGVVEPIGGGEVRVSVRVVAATHRDLPEMVGREAFREDLLFRLRVVELKVPALRERGEDPVLLARHFLEEVSPRPLRLAPDAEAALRAYAWPGNVRELRNAIERAAIFCRGGIVQGDDFPAELRSAPSGSGPEAGFVVWGKGEDFSAAKKRLVERFEREILRAALREHGGNVSSAARELGLHRQSLQQKLRRLGIDASEFGSS
jgi:DNA-binding NtrC family response regulator